MSKERFLVDVRGEKEIPHPVEVAKRKPVKLRAYRRDGLGEGFGPSQKTILVDRDKKTLK